MFQEQKEYIDPDLETYMVSSTKFYSHLEKYPPHYAFKRQLKSV